MYCVGQGKTRGRIVWVGKTAWNPRGFIAPNPRKVRGVHELRDLGTNLSGYYYCYFLLAEE